MRALAIAAALVLAGCSVPRETVQVPPGFSASLCEVGPRGYPRELTPDEMKLCARYNPVTRTMGQSQGGQLFHSSAWGKPFDLSPVPVRGW